MNNTLCTETLLTASARDGAAAAAADDRPGCTKTTLPALLDLCKKVRHATEGRTPDIPLDNKGRNKL